MARWLKWPGPGEFRGEGEWKKIPEPEDDPEQFKYWAWCKETGYLPVREQDDEPGRDEK